MRITIRPVADRQREIDLTHRLIAVIAEELWRLYGGNEHLNWLEAELHLQAIVGQARAEVCAAKTPIAETPGTATASQKQGSVEVGDPLRQRRSTRRESPSGSRPRTAHAGQSRTAVSA
ncbi:MAG: hypothetical protein AB7Q00_07060 [Phycisphaerales bacterium]